MAQLHKKEETSMLRVELPTDSRAPAQRKKYAAPRLVDYGSLEKLTQTGSGSGADGGSAGMSMVCL